MSTTLPSIRIALLHGADVSPKPGLLWMLRSHVPPKKKEKEGSLKPHVVRLLILRFKIRKNNNWFLEIFKFGSLDICGSFSVKSV